MPRFLLLVPLLCSVAHSQDQPLPAHPRLLLDAAGVARLKARIATAPWSAQWATLQRSVDRSLAETIDLPPRGSNWYHWYVCPKHGARLTTGKRIGAWQWEHICPVDKEVLHGDPTRPDRDFDGAELASVHSRYADAIRDCGLLFQVTGDAKYSSRARNILLAYAERYLSYPLHNTQGVAKVGGGRVGPQTLDEAVWLIPVAQGTDLIWDTLSETDRATIADKLFLPAARDVILPHHMGVHNIQNWKNSAVGLTGFLLGDRDLIHNAIDDEAQGYRTQMAKGVQEDGVWFEGAWGYHFYTLNALWPLVEASRNCGTDLYGEPLKKMFLAPIRLAMPNLKLPSFNDSVETDVHNQLYELAYARYRAPEMLAAIPKARTDSFALWFGDDQLPAAPVAAIHSFNAAASGYAILTRGEGTDTSWLCLKYGPSGGGHGHPDKNNFILYTRGLAVFPDPGTRPYGSPLHGGWDKVTVAHNTLVVDQVSQTPATGRTLAFGADYSMTDAGNIYPGVHFVRTAVLLDRNTVVFVDRVEADKTHTYDMAVHAVGLWHKPPTGAASVLSPKDGYQHLRDVAGTHTDAGISLTVDVKPDWPIAIALAGSDPTDVITATGVGQSTEDRVPVALFRRTAKNTTYVWAVSLNGAPIKLEAHDDGGITGVRVNAATRLTVTQSPPSVRVVR